LMLFRLALVFWVSCGFAPPTLPSSASLGGGNGGWFSSIAARPSLLNVVLLLV
jgi:hypothetical protein